MSDNIRDGGYYAIKGFAYQIDKAIIELLSLKDENKSINIEQIQDINTDDYVIQVKYKEKSKLTPSVINTPIIQLIEEFRKDSSKTYILYAYFDDLNGFESNKGKITQEKFDELLGNKKNDIDEQTRKFFNKNFLLIFSKEFENQFSVAVEKIKEVFGISLNEEAVFYYSNISDYFYKLVTNNDASNISRRTCTKKEIIDYIRNGKNIIFNAAFRDYKGDDNYFKFIKKKYFNSQNIDDFERFMIIEITDMSMQICNIKQVALQIKNKFYNNSRGVIKSSAPFVYLNFIANDEKILPNLKQELLNEGITFKDGFDFEGASFNIDTISERSTKENKVSLKFVNNDEILKQLIGKNFKRTKEIYEFYSKNTMDIDCDIKHVKIQIKDISDIEKILN